MRVELARTPAEAHAELGDLDDPRRDDLRFELLIDFVFVAVYWLVFIVMSVFLARRDFSAAVWLGTIAAEGATLAALCDMSENVRTLRLLRLAPTDTEPFARAVLSIRRASLAKWASVFVTTGILSASFLEEGGWHLAIGVLFLTSAAVGGAAVAMNALGRTRAWALGVGLALVGISLVSGLPIAAALD